jgi:predicted AAA+ superfamily ATPase
MVGDLAVSRQERRAARPRLHALLTRYLVTGGFLVALNDEAGTQQVRAETFELFRESIIGEFTRARLREGYLREVVNWLADHAGQEFDTRGIAADTDIGSKDTAQNYVDQLVATYVADVFYRTPSLERPSPAFRSPKKIHLLDPLLWHLIQGWAASDPDPWLAAASSLDRASELGHLVESVLAVHLRRAYGDAVFYWRPDARREIDFVVDPRMAPVQLIEVKYRTRIDEGELRVLAQAGGGIVASRDTDEALADGRIHVLPLAELLVLLDTRSLAPSHRL